MSLTQLDNSLSYEMLQLEATLASVGFPPTFIRDRMTVRECRAHSLLAAKRKLEESRSIPQALMLAIGSVLSKDGAEAAKALSDEISRQTELLTNEVRSSFDLEIPSSAGDAPRQEAQQSAAVVSPVTSEETKSLKKLRVANKVHKVFKELSLTSMPNPFEAMAKKHGVA